VYTVCNATATSFQLQLASILGTCFPYAVTANGSVGTSRFVPAVVDLGPALGGGSGGRIVVDLTAVGTGTGLLQVSTMAPSLPAGVASESRVSGEGGGFIRVGSVRPTTTVSGDLALTIGAGAAITAGGDIAVHALNTAAGLADGTSSGLGFISVGAARSVVSATATTNVAVQSGTRLVSTGGGVVIDPFTVASGNAYAYSSAGGFGHGTESNTRADLAITSHVTLDGLIQAWNDVAASSTTGQQSDLQSGATGGSFAGSSSAGDGCNEPCHLVATNTADLTVGGGAVIEADNVTLAAQMVSTNLKDYNRSNGDGAFEDSDATSDVNLTSTVHVQLNAPAKIVGHQSVTITAQHQKLDVFAQARATCGCFGGDSDAHARSHFTATTSVTAQQGVRIRTAILRVEAQYLNTNIHAAASTGGGFIDFGGSGDGADVVMNRGIDWNADVYLHAPDPTLVVDASGRIVKLYGLTVRDDLGTVYILGQTIPAGRTIVVDPIENTGGGRATYFVNNPGGGQDGVITGTEGTLHVQNTFDVVRLYNFSGLDLEVNGISVVNLDHIGATVDVQAEQSGAFRFHIGKPIFTPTFVDIANWAGPGTADLILNGAIDNPIGTTSVIDEHGDITATGTGSIRTNIARLHAEQGSIGAVFTVFGITLRFPVRITLVQSDYLVDDVDPTRPVALTVDAWGDAVLDLTYSARMPVGSPYAATAFRPVLGPIHAGRDVDIVVHDSLSGSDAPAFSSYLVQVNVSVPPNLSVFVGATGQYHTYFHPDPGPWGGFTDPVLVAWGTTNTVHDAAYTFSDVAAGDDIRIVHAETASTITFDVTSNVDARLYSLRRPAQLNSVSDGDGEITLFTNGWIEDRETIGDLRVGTITSTHDDVTLTALENTASILDDGTITDGSARGGTRHRPGRRPSQRPGRRPGPVRHRLRRRPARDRQLVLRAWRCLRHRRRRHPARRDGRGLLRNLRAVAHGRPRHRDRNGSIRNDVDDRSTRFVARNIDLVASGAVGASTADFSGDLYIDTAETGRLVAFSGAPRLAGVFITEATGSLSVLLAVALGGGVRLRTLYDPTPHASRSSCCPAA
jgi:hypothetical protein